MSCEQKAERFMGKCLRFCIHGFVIPAHVGRALELGVLGEPGVGEVDGGAATAVEGEAVGSHGGDVTAVHAEGGGGGLCR